MFLKSYLSRLNVYCSAPNILSIIFRSRLTRKVGSEKYVLPCVNQPEQSVHLENNVEKDELEKDLDLVFDFQSACLAFLSLSTQFLLLSVDLLQSPCTLARVLIAHNNNQLIFFRPTDVFTVQAF